jgi:quinol-cytochrome oxidoreductase complex cytochrome b subunit
MTQLSPWPLVVIFGGFVLLIAMHYWMAWKANHGVPKSEHIEARRDNYLQVYRAYKKVTRDKFVPFLAGVGLLMIASGFGYIVFGSITEGSR